MNSKVNLLFIDFGWNERETKGGPNTLCTPYIYILFMRLDDMLYDG